MATGMRFFHEVSFVDEEGRTVMGKVPVVQELVRHGVQKLPARFIRDVSPPSLLDHHELESLAFVDMAKLGPEVDPSCRAEELRKLAASAESWGMFFVTGHGVPPALMASVAKVLKAFFHLSLEEKRASVGSYNDLDNLGYGRSFVKSEDQKLDWIRSPDHEGAPQPRLPGSPSLASESSGFQVNAFYRFRSVTATLSVNYLDRFLSSQTLPKGVGWPWQLLSVACLSVAAKMEETHVPLLVDLQILEPRFVFEPRTVRRMELLLMSALRWRMRSVTPFDFVDHFAGLLHEDCPGGEGYAPLFCRASDLILATHGVLDFLGYRPSELAAAAVLCASGDKTETIPSFYDVVSKEAVERCRQLMEVYATDAGPKGGPELAVPRSPSGVLDAAACGSFDTHKSSSEAAPNPEPAGAVEPPANKRRRLSAATSTCTKESKLYEH